MKKEGKVQNDKRKKEIILITVIALIGIIVGGIVIRNVVVKKQVKRNNPNSISSYNNSATNISSSGN